MRETIIIENKQSRLFDNMGKRLYYLNKPTGISFYWSYIAKEYYYYCYVLKMKRNIRNKRRYDNYER